MTSITKDFMKKIIEEQGILDTRNYRYIAVDKETAARLPIGRIGTTAAIGAKWEEVKVR